MKKLLIACIALILLCFAGCNSNSQNNEFNIENVLNIVYLCISLIAIIVSPIISLYLFFRDSSKLYLKDRYEKVVFPIYDKLEDFLYNREITDQIQEIYNNCQQIILNNKSIAGGNMIEVFYKPLSSKHLKVVSKLIDKEYDKCCKKLGIPIRSLEYRINKFPNNKRMFIIYLVLYSIILLLLLLLALIVIFCLLISVYVFLIYLTNK